MTVDDSRTHPGICSFSDPAVDRRTVPQLSRLTVHGTVMVELAFLLNSISVLITLIPRTTAAYPELSSLGAERGFRRGRRRPPHVSTSAIPLQCGDSFEITVPGDCPWSCEQSRFFWVRTDGGHRRRPSFRGHGAVRPRHTFGHPERHRLHSGIRSSSVAVTFEPQRLNRRQRPRLSRVTACGNGDVADFAEKSSRQLWKKYVFTSPAVCSSEEETNAHCVGTGSP